MDQARLETDGSQDDAAEGGRHGWFAAGGILCAILASTCCIAPLVLLTLGVSGAWIGALAAMEPYKPFFAAVASVFVGLGFRQVHFRTGPACIGDACGAKPRSASVATAVLWIAAMLAVLALTTGWWAPLFS
jgi:mercuric ion transport protein